MVSLYPQHSILQLAPSQQHQSFHTQAAQFHIVCQSYSWECDRMCALKKNKRTSHHNSRELRPTYHRRHRNRTAASFKSRKVKLDISSAVGTALTFSHT
jgi:hypothetical protein